MELTRLFPPRVEGWKQVKSLGRSNISGLEAPMGLETDRQYSATGIGASSLGWLLWGGGEREKDMSTLKRLRWAG